LLSFGFVDGHPVFMDERCDSYFRLDDETEAEFLEWVGTEEAFSAAFSQGRQTAIAPSEGLPSAILAQAPLPRQSLLDELGPRFRARISDTVKVARLLRRARFTIARRPIAETLSKFAHREEAERLPLSGIELRERAARFVAARRLVPIAPNCLADSLSLLDWLGPSPGTLLVFGVKLDPFAAHCWVQLGDMLLNDRTDHVAAFRPVRVIQCSPATQ
jgi:hypothetical protein